MDAKRYYHDRERIVCLRGTKKDGTESRVLRGMSGDGKTAYAVIVNNHGAVTIIISDVTTSPTPPRK